jgi:hypothetical protein
LRGDLEVEWTRRARLRISSALMSFNPPQVITVARNAVALRWSWRGRCSRDPWQRCCRGHQLQGLPLIWTSFRKDLCLVGLSICNSTRPGAGVAGRWGRRVGRCSAAAAGAHAPLRGGADAGDAFGVAQGSAPVRCAAAAAAQQCRPPCAAGADRRQCARAAPVAFVSAAKLLSESRGTSASELSSVGIWDKPVTGAESRALALVPDVGTRVSIERGRRR